MIILNNISVIVVLDSPKIEQSKYSYLSILKAVLILDSDSEEFNEVENVQSINPIYVTPEKSKPRESTTSFEINFNIDDNCMKDNKITTLNANDLNINKLQETEWISNISNKTSTIHTNSNSINFNDEYSIFWTEIDLQK